MMEKECGASHVSGREHPAMQDVVSIAKDAGAAILQQLRSGLAAQRKSDDSPVTAADEASNTIIKEGLRRLTPHLPIVSEEDMQEQRATAAASALHWVIDPLDGTKTAMRYAEGHHDHNQFGVHIGLVKGNTPIAGVAFFPAMEKGIVYFTGDDGHAYKQTGMDAPRPIQVAKLPLRDGKLRAAVHAKEDRRPERIAGRSYIPVPGVGGQRVCLVAEGAADLADINDIPEGLRGRYAYKQWDLAASHAILRAAGGELVNPETKKSVTYDDPEQNMPGALAGGKETLTLLGLANGEKDERTRENATLAL